ncbi:DUF4145 domain-containing protein [Sedimenticola thiotaurini]|uniref:DUF4145 domain-containing protein n=1 Tax=Sedimenticola thiotaurini TaxID=1543721 RepID=A0A0F7JZ72_9GAMM|nr:hypothetical protein AAY24_12510 [Sedimenticola thiotaurini]
MEPNPDSVNFSFLAEYDPIFLQLVAAAEGAFASDPNTTLIKLRQFGEALAQDLAVRSGVQFDETTTQADLLGRLHRQIRLDPTIRELFHTLRVEGNRATHQFRTRHKEAMDGLKMARDLALWYHHCFGQPDASFKPGPFTPPPDPTVEEKTQETHGLKKAREARPETTNCQGVTEATPGH